MADERSAGPTEGFIMSDNELELGRVQGDLAVLQRAMGLRPPFGRGMLAFGLLLAVAAVGAAAISLLAEREWGQLTPIGTLLVLGPVGLYVRSRRRGDLDPDVALQVAVSITLYCVVWLAACGYAWATLIGPAVGPARTAGLYATSVGLLAAFSLLLVRAAVRRREQHYCLGLAVATVLAGMLLPVLDGRYSYPLAHGFLAAGYLTAAAIQWGQLRKAVPAREPD
jgi:hypothetical protein